MSLLAQRKSTSVFSYLEESAVPMRTTLPLGLSGSMGTSLEPSLGSKDPVDHLLDGGKLSRGDNCCGVTTTLDLTLIGMLEGGADGDDPTRARYF